MRVSYGSSDVCSSDLGRHRPAHPALPDQLTLPLMWLGLIASVDNLYMPALPALVGAVIGYLSLWTVWWLFKKLPGKAGMGHGDFKLLAALGALYGQLGNATWRERVGPDGSTPV